MQVVVGCVSDSVTHHFSVPNHQPNRNWEIQVRDGANRRA